MRLGLVSYAIFFKNRRGYTYKTSISVKVVWLPFPICDVSEACNRFLRNRTFCVSGGLQAKAFKSTSKNLLTIRESNQAKLKPTLSEMSQGDGGSN